jgi:hypothetical protein
MSVWVKALYMELVENFPLLEIPLKLIIPVSQLDQSWTFSKAFQDAILGPTRSLPNGIFCGEDSIFSHDLVK